MNDIADNWTRQGLVLGRATDYDSYHVVGDPSIVWDDEASSWRMFLFYDPPGHGHAVSRSINEFGPGDWTFEGPICFTNPEAFCGINAHKPYILTEAHRPNMAAKIGGKFTLLIVVCLNGSKIVQAAHATSLGGPWTLDTWPLIDVGGQDDFDGRHVDAVSGVYFPEREEILYFYMGYPLAAQPQALSPYGSSQGAAVQKVGCASISKLGRILPPAEKTGHWAAGWVGGLQLLPGRTHRWIALINASPTAPDYGDQNVYREEPPPSLGGFAYCDEEFPDRNWTFCDKPIEWIENVPQSALDEGEGYNLWRQHILVTKGGEFALFYNSGYYGKEQLFLKIGLPAKGTK
jgi:hypothetical protein